MYMHLEIHITSRDICNIHLETHVTSRDTCYIQLQIHITCISRYMYLVSLDICNMYPEMLVRVSRDVCSMYLEIHVRYIQRYGHVTYICP